MTIDVFFGASLLAFAVAHLWTARKKYRKESEERDRFLSLFSEAQAEARNFRDLSARNDRMLAEATRYGDKTAVLATALGLVDEARGQLPYLLDMVARKCVYENGNAVAAGMIDNWRGDVRFRGWEVGRWLESADAILRKWRAEP